MSNSPVAFSIKFSEYTTTGYFNESLVHYIWRPDPREGFDSLAELNCVQQLNLTNSEA